MEMLYLMIVKIFSQVKLYHISFYARHIITAGVYLNAECSKIQNKTHTKTVITTLIMNKRPPVDCAQVWMPNYYKNKRSQEKK